ESAAMLGGGLVPASAFASDGTRDKRSAPAPIGPKTLIVGSIGVTDFLPPPPPPHPGSVIDVSATTTNGTDHRTRFEDISRSLLQAFTASAAAGRQPLDVCLMRVKMLSAASSHPGVESLK